MKIGLKQPFFNFPGKDNEIGATLIDIAKTAESSGFSSFWLMDHFYQVGQGFGRYTDRMLEAYVSLGFLAGVTEKIKLGTLVTGSIYRNPGLLVKMVTTLDVLSKGRAYLGIGTGWFKEEAEAFGLTFPESRKELISRFVETLKIAKHIWAYEGDFKGRYWSLKSPVTNPPPVTKPHPPILIGCEGETTMLKIVARYADAINMHAGTPLPGYGEWLLVRYDNKKRDLSRKLGILEKNCEQYGRDFLSIEKTALATIQIDDENMSVDEVIRLCIDLNDIGLNQVIFNMPNAYLLDPLKEIGMHVIPEIKDL